MTARHLALRFATVLALVACADGAMAARARAQPTATAPAAAAPAAAAPAAPAGPPVSYGPPIPGVCVVSRNDALAASAVGKSFADRMNVLQNQIASQLQPTATQLAADQRALQAATTPDQAKIDAFTRKAQDYERLKDQRLQQLDATRQKQVQRLLLELQPVLQVIFQQKQCTILLDRDSAVIGVNPAMDLTSASIIGLNARIQSITFDLEPPPAPGTAGAPQ